MSRIVWSNGLNECSDARYDLVIDTSGNLAQVFSE